MRKIVFLLSNEKIFEKLKKQTKFSIELDDIEEKIIKLIKPKYDFSFKVLFANYKRYLYKHILELLKE